MSILPECMFMYYVYLVPKIARRGIGYPGTGVRDGWKPHVPAWNRILVL